MACYTPAASCRRYVSAWPAYTPTSLDQRTDMLRNATHLRLVTCLMATLLMHAAEVHAQRPVDTRTANVNVPAIARPADTEADYRLAAERFRTSVSLTSVDLPTTRQTGLPGVDVKWALYPGAARYRVLRGMTATGPWISVYEDRNPAFTFGYVPPDAKLFVRVVPLRQEGEKYVAVDTSALIDTRLAHKYFGAGAPTLQCGSQAPLTALIHWQPIPLASAYIVNISRSTPSPNPGMFRIINVISTQTVRDSLVSFTDATEGRYGFTVQAQFAFPDWNARGDTVHVRTAAILTATGQVAGGVFTCGPTLRYPTVL